jgi:uncharacterized protein YunC (DUF1805 family)
VKAIEAHVIALQKSNLVLLKAKNGYLMCGYLNLEVAERLGDAAAIVTGVSSAQEALEAKVKSATRAAKALGVAEGMSGRDALRLMGK